MSTKQKSTTHTPKPKTQKKTPSQKESVFTPEDFQAILTTLKKISQPYPPKSDATK